MMHTNEPNEAKKSAKQQTHKKVVRIYGISQDEMRLFGSAAVAAIVVGKTSSRSFCQSSKVLID